MANKTYLEVINIALRDINEVPINISSFNNVRGIQAAALEMVNRAYADILNYTKEWPFLSDAQGTKFEIPTVEDQQEYEFPTEISNVDWDSFFIVSDNKDHTVPLQTIDQDFYIKNLKQNDLLPSGEVLRPLFVYRTKNNKGYGLSPIPKGMDYSVSFHAFIKPTLLKFPTQEIIIPERYYNVLISRARYYLWMFRENTELAGYAAQEYERGIRQMYRDLVAKQSIDMRVR
jgi:hypothetical protein